MSDNRKYYYLKLKENYFDDDSIVLLESMQDGVLYSNILLKLYLKSLKHGGRLQLDEDIPYTAQMIATITRQQIGTVERALQIFLKLGLVEVLDSGTFYMSNIELLIGQSSTEAERKRAARLQNKALSAPRTNGGHLSDIRPPEIEIELEKEIDIKREIEKGRSARAYGRYQNVFLTDEELADLQASFPTVWGQYIEKLSEYMREFSRISFVYESKVLPIGAVFGILSWLSCPLVILLAYAPWVAGTLNTVDYLLICMLPLFCAKLANSIFVDLTSYKNLMISKNKILSVMNEPEETGSMEPLHTATHEITFDNVDFAYVPGEPVLKHATFTVPDQKLTAIVGDSGSGKSTILNLIAKYYEATGGTISIGGKPINHVAAERVLEQVSMVDQDIFLFDDTIRDNIRHARPNATDTEIEAACREANCDSFIRKMEKGYDTPTGENGNLLSGGERQRISIARAILKNSPILLLDEATASLDIENELAVKQAIANLLKEKKTVVMIAHTLSIVKNADQILVMGDGRIAESGTHEELLAKGGKYAAMWNAEQKISA